MHSISPDLTELTAKKTLVQIMPISLSPTDMPTVLTTASTHTRSPLQHLWKTATRTSHYQAVIRSARSSASHHIMLCGTTAYLKRLDRIDTVDRLEDLLVVHGTGVSSAATASAGLMMMLDSVEDLEASERAWKSIAEILKQIDEYLVDAVGVEKGEEGVELHRHETTSVAAGRLRMLEGMIVEAARQAERVAVRDPMQCGVKAKL